MGIDAQILVKSKTNLTRDELRELSIQLYSMFSNILFFPNPKSYCIEPCGRFMQDGPTLKPSYNEHFYEVFTGCRYYGIGYERGPIIEIAALCDALKRMIPDCSVWYGDDSSGVCAKEFTEQYRNQLLDHFYKVAHRPYRGYSLDTKQILPICPRCQIAMYETAWAGALAGCNCHGCDNKCITKNKTEIVRFLDPYEGFFEAMDKVNKSDTK